MTKIVLMLVWAIVFYYVFKTVRGVYRLMMKAARMQNNNSNINPNSEFGNNRQNNHGKYNINNKDIVDAEFTEIKPEDEKNNENK